MSARTYLQWTDPAAAAALAALAVDDEPQAWQDQALCAQVDPESFFPEKGGSIKEAKKVCMRCDVRAECLEYALEHDERFGIWGAKSERERREITRERRRQREVAAENEKLCSECQEVKPLAEFSPKRGSVGYRCKACSAAYLRAWRRRRQQEKAA